MNTKKLLCGSLSLLMCLTLAACGAKQDESEQSADDDQTAEPEWKVNGSYSAMVAGEERDLFTNTLQSDEMKNLEPVAVLGEQVVSGMNYAYLAFNTEQAPGRWEVAVLYKAADGKSQFINRSELVPDSLEQYTVAETGEDLLGAWSYRSSGKPGALSENGEKALSAAVEKAGIQVMPVALLGSIEEEAEYTFLAYGTKDDKNVVYVLTVKNNELTETRILDIGKIVQPEENN